MQIYIAKGKGFGQLLDNFYVGFLSLGSFMPEDKIL